MPKKNNSRIGFANSLVKSDLLNFQYYLSTFLINCIYMETFQNSGIKITVSGHVQGVGFRYFIARFASPLGLTGYAKNLFSGDVEILAFGRKEYLDALADKAAEGPRGSGVKSCKTEWLDFNKKYDKFEIL